MSVEKFLLGCRRAVSALAAAVDEIDATIPAEMIANAVDRGIFRPQEEAALLAWFARFLTIRSELWEVIGDVSAPVNGRVEGIFDTEEWRCFVLGYTSACLVVRLDRTLLESVAPASLTQRKLNEGSTLHRIPRKQYTEIFESFTDPAKARQMAEGHAPGARSTASVERHGSTTPLSVNSWLPSVSARRSSNPVGGGISSF